MVKWGQIWIWFMLMSSISQCRKTEIHTWQEDKILKSLVGY